MAGPGMGLGHLVRCLALAQMLENIFRIEFYCKEIPVEIEIDIKSKGIHVHRLETEGPFYKALLKSDIVVLDGYQFDFSTQQSIKVSGATLVCIDDLHDKAYIADLIINHCPGISSADYRTLIHTQFALGKDYVLLRPAFLKACSVLERKNEKNSLMICFGGSDSKDLSSQVLKLVIQQEWLKKITVVTGPAYAYSNELDAFCSTDKRLEHLHGIDEDKLMDLMLRTSIAIVPTSGILLEVLACGMKAISGYFVENHKFIYSNYKAAGAFIDAGNFNNEDIIKALKTAFTNENRQQQFFDGKSGERIAQLFENLLVEQKIILREANADDIEQTFLWANNPVIRSFSFNKSQIKKADHIKWFRKKLSDPNCFYLIPEKDGRALGSIRFDLGNLDALISYLIDPQFHGQGYGQILLQKGLEFLISKLSLTETSVRSITGKVFKKNIPSVKAFQRLGFEVFAEDDELITYRKLLSM